MKLAILTSHSSQYTLMASFTNPTKQKYAEMHGYYYCEALLNYPETPTEGARNQSWAKLISLKETMEKGLYDWIWWSDIDVVILNPKHRLDRLIDNTVHVIGGQFNFPPGLPHTLHTGSFLIKCDAWSLRFLDYWIYNDTMVQFYQSDMREEDAARWLYHTRPDVQSQFKFIPLRYLTTWIPLPSEHGKETKWSDRWTRYHPGDFSLHVPSCISYNERISIILKYMNMNEFQWN